MSTSDQDPTDQDRESTVSEEPTGHESDDHGAAVTEDEYARGTTSDPDGATRDEPAGEDYAGSGF